MGGVRGVHHKHSHPLNAAAATTEAASAAASNATVAWSCARDLLLGAKNLITFAAYGALDCGSALENHPGTLAEVLVLKPPPRTRHSMVAAIKCLAASSKPAGGRK